MVKLSADEQKRHIRPSLWVRQHMDAQLLGCNMEEVRSGISRAIVGVGRRQR